MSAAHLQSSVRLRGLERRIARHPKRRAWPAIPLAGEGPLPVPLRHVVCDQLVDAEREAPRAKKGVGINHHDGPVAVTETECHRRQLAPDKTK